MQKMKPPPAQSPEDAPTVCSICGQITKKTEIGAAGQLKFVRMRDVRVGTWALWICKPCLMNMEEIEKGGETLAQKKAGWHGTEHI